MSDVWEYEHAISDILGIREEVVFILCMICLGGFSFLPAKLLWLMFVYIYLHSALPLNPSCSGVIYTGSEDGFVYISNTLKTFTHFSLKDESGSPQTIKHITEYGQNLNLLLTSSLPVGKSSQIHTLFDVRAKAAIFQLPVRAQTFSFAPQPPVQS